MAIPGGRWAVLAALVALGAAVGGPARSAGEAGKGPEVDWVKGPAKVDLGSVAELEVPKGFVFTGRKGTQDLLKAMGNLVGDNEQGFLAPATVFDKESAERWFVVFEFSEIGYVKDDEKDKLDPVGLLKGFQEGNVRANKEREKLGYEKLELTGWAVEPHYDEKTNNLEWGLMLKSEKGHETVNYEIRLLGRKGVMSCTLVLGPKELNTGLPRFRALLGGYGYKTGERYSEYRAGDKIAKYGLIGLIGAGGLAVAAKTGLLKYIWKYLVFIVLAVAAFFKNLWKRLFGRRTIEDEDEKLPPPPPAPNTLGGQGGA
jgi:uncharacterized membrane-anchored protein